MIFTVVEQLTAAQPPDGSVVYVTVYNPGVLVLGVITPEAEIARPAGLAE